MGPIGPGDPDDPFSPECPWSPFAPSNPGNPRCPLIPGRPGMPGKPRGPTGPSEPWGPISPSSPASPLDWNEKKLDLKNVTSISHAYVFSRKPGKSSRSRWPARSRRPRFSRLTSSSLKTLGSWWSRRSYRGKKEQNQCYFECRLVKYNV